MGGTQPVGAVPWSPGMTGLIRPCRPTLPLPRQALPKPAHPFPPSGLGSHGSPQKATHGEQEPIGGKLQDHRQRPRGVQAEGLKEARRGCSAHCTLCCLRTLKGRWVLCLGGSHAAWCSFQAAAGRHRGSRHGVRGGLRAAQLQGALPLFPCGGHWERGPLPCLFCSCHS